MFVYFRILRRSAISRKKRPTQSTGGDHNAREAGHARLTDIHVSLLSRENTGAQARPGERALFGCRTAQLAFCLSAVVPAFAEPDIHSLSPARRPSHALPVFIPASMDCVSVTNSAGGGRVSVWMRSLWVKAASFAFDGGESVSMVWRLEYQKSAASQQFHILLAGTYAMPMGAKAPVPAR